MTLADISHLTHNSRKMFVITNGYFQKETEVEISTKRVSSSGLGMLAEY